jgi:hypothetical protein
LSAFNEDRGAFILLAGGVLLIISLFLPHWESGYTAWYAFKNLRIIILLIGTIAVGFGLLEATGAARTLPDPIPLVLAALGVAVFGFAAGWELQVSGAGGVWLAIVGSIAIGVGGWGVRRHDLVIREARTPGSVRPDPAVTARPVDMRRSGRPEGE